MRKLPFSTLAGWLFLGLSFGVQYAQAAVGNLDATFGTNGVTTTSAANTDSIINSMLLLRGDKILVFAGEATPVQYTSGGVLDRTFAAMEPWFSRLPSAAAWRYSRTDRS